MRSKKSIVIFLAVDIVAVLVIVLVLVISNPFKAKVAPNTDPTTTTTKAPDLPNSGSDMQKLNMDEMKVLHEMPSFIGMREESEMTEDGKYYTSYRADLDLDLDGDGELESVSISLDDHSESFYVLVNDGGNLTDYVVPGTEFAFREQYQAKACKGMLRGVSMDLDSSDPYTEVAIEMIRESWEDYQTLVVRYDGSSIHASVVPGKLNALSNAGSVQFSFNDEIYGVHTLYRTYDITSEVDFLKAKTTYFFTDTNVEKTSFLYNTPFDITCENLTGEACVISAGSTFYWCRTDNETYVDVITSDNSVYRLPIQKEVIEYETGDQAVYRLGDHDAAEIKTR